MITPEVWMPDAVARLGEAFGERLLYLGLQGSYRRGEATEASDIDLVAIIDNFTLADLDAYRSVVRSMPEGEKACGFLGGREEFLVWPRHEMFSLKMDTADWFGRLGDFLPPISREDVVAAERIGAAGLYHPLVHTYIYADDAVKAEFIRAAFKGAFFVLQSSQYLRTGVFAPSRKALCVELSGDERTIAEAGVPGSDWLDKHSVAEAYDLLLQWARSILRTEHGTKV